MTTLQQEKIYFKKNQAVGFDHKSELCRFLSYCTVKFGTDSTVYSEFPQDVI